MYYDNKPAAVLLADKARWQIWYFAVKAASTRTSSADGRAENSDHAPYYTEIHQINTNKHAVPALPATHHNHFVNLSNGINVTYILLILLYNNIICLNGSIFQDFSGL